MLAAVYQPGNQALVLDKNYPIRELEDNEILVKIAASGGLCLLFVSITYFPLKPERFA
jgi:D-arabinose 1-dehydrogenase-like Zn-dependent alcohol dehydrogenase